ncbi:MAG: 16S rRNA (guanine(527)-N(7))-methyltransferase RsmG [Elusimicrobiota bacterium]|nr:16S rRNA (guanine(527)-N(7))-methyltransferase RsmG [Elusimicrobiota bacterium]
MLQEFIPERQFDLKEHKTMDKDLQILFKDYVLKEMSEVLSAEKLSQFCLYFDEIIEWNKKFNLISFKDEKDLLFRHFCDSLYGVKLIKELSASAQLKIADIGTGAGLPGIPVKFAFPQSHITLIESISKKCSFLKNINEKLNLNMEILNARCEEIGQDKKYRGSFDFVLSRAVCKMRANLEISIPLLKKNGCFLVYKTKNSLDDEREGIKSSQNALNQLGAKMHKLFDYRIENYENNYCIAVFKKIKDTPNQFPRKTGIPEKNPL